MHGLWGSAVSWVVTSSKQAAFFHTKAGRRILWLYSCDAPPVQMPQTNDPCVFLFGRCSGLSGVARFTSPHKKKGVAYAWTLNCHLLNSVSQIQFERKVFKLVLPPPHLKTWGQTMDIPLVTLFHRWISEKTMKEQLRRFSQTNFPNFKHKHCTRQFQLSLTLKIRQESWFFSPRKMARLHGSRFYMYICTLSGKTDHEDARKKCFCREPQEAKKKKSGDLC